jgi:N-acetylglutamate synthase/N-acetylornithine aminotransferase
MLRFLQIFLLMVIAAAASYDYVKINADYRS